MKFFSASAVLAVIVSGSVHAQTVGDQLLRGVLGAAQRQINGATQPLPSGMSAGPAPQAAPGPVLWADKAAFLDAARRGELSQISRVAASPQSEDAATVTRSIGYLLASSYGVPGLPRDAAGCAFQFRQNVLSLLDAVTAIHVSTLTDSPPAFYREPRQGGRQPESVVRDINASPNCDLEVLGLRKPHPYKAALIDLMGQYGESTKAYVESERASRQAAAVAATISSPSPEPARIDEPPAALKRPAEPAKRIPAKPKAAPDDQTQI